MTQSKQLLSVLVLALAVAACGGSQGGSDTTTSGPGQTQPTGGDTTTQPSEETAPTEPDSTQAPAQGDLGWFSIDGERTVATHVMRCDEDGGLDTPGIIAYGSLGDDSRVQLDVTLGESRDSVHVDLSGQGFVLEGGLWDQDGDGTWTDNRSSEPVSFTFESGRTRGGPVTVADDEERVVEWDLEIPADEDPNCY